MTAANEATVFGLLLFASFRRLYKSSNLVRVTFCAMEAAQLLSQCIKGLHYLNMHRLLTHLAGIWCILFVLKLSGAPY